MLNIEYTCRVLPFKEKGKPDAPLRCRVSWEDGSRRVSFNLGYRVDPQKWDSRMQACVPGSFHGTRRDPAAAINRAISAVRTKVEGFFAQCSERALSPSEAEFRAAVLDEAADAAPLTIVEAAERFMLDQSGVREWEPKSEDNYRRLIYRLKEWDGTALLSEMDADAIADFVQSMKDDEMRHTTINTVLVSLKAVLAWAVKKRYPVPSSWKDAATVLKTAEQRPVYLEWDELMRLWELDLGPVSPHNSLAAARDVFCFCAFTSLRFSDAHRLRWSSVRRSSILATTKKTVKPIEIDLNRWSQAVLDKYVDEDFGGYVLPRVGITTVIRYVKSLCARVGVDEPVNRVFYRGGKLVEETHPKWELVSSHTARKTFVVHALSSGVPAQVVMKWTGHRDYKSLLPYIDIADSSRAAAMQKIEGHDPE